MSDFSLAKKLIHPHTHFTNNKNPEVHSWSGKGAGFTLLEMVIALGLFSLVTVAFVGITLSLLDAQRKAANAQVVQENARFIMELLTKEIRAGTNFTASTTCAPAGKEIRFTTTDPLPPNRTYFFSSNRLMRLKAFALLASQCANAIELSGEDLFVENIDFFLRGQRSESSDPFLKFLNDGQPTITINMRVSGREPLYGSQTILNLQTTVVVRIRDVPTP